MAALEAWENVSVRGAALCNTENRDNIKTIQVLIAFVSLFLDEFMMFRPTFKYEKVIIIPVRAEILYNVE